jgi:hypothetical protein
LKGRGFSRAGRQPFFAAALAAEAGTSLNGDQKPPPHGPSGAAEVARFQTMFIGGVLYCKEVTAFV